MREVNRFRFRLIAECFRDPRAVLVFKSHVRVPRHPFLILLLDLLKTVHDICDLIPCIYPALTNPALIHGHCKIWFHKLCTAKNVITSKKIFLILSYFKFIMLFICETLPLRELLILIVIQYSIYKIN